MHRQGRRPPTSILYLSERYVRNFFNHDRENIFSWTSLSSAPISGFLGRQGLWSTEWALQTDNDPGLYQCMKGKLMKKIVVLLATLLFIPASLMATSSDSSQRALIEELMTLTKVRENMENKFDAIEKMISAQMAQIKPQDPAKQPELSREAALMLETIHQELNWDKMKEDYIKLYADTFTAEELKGMVAFYKSPEGQAFISKQPELTKRSMELGQKKMGEIMPKIQAIVRDMQKRVRESTPAKTQQENK